MVKLADTFSEDLWIHLAAILAVGIGVAGWYSIGLAKDPSSVQLMFIIGGLAGLGLKIVNGSAAALRTTLIAQQVAAAAGLDPQTGIVVVAPGAVLPRPAPPPPPA